MDVAANLRAALIHNERLRRAADILAQYADQPIESMRSFVTNYVAEADTFMERLEAGEQIDLYMVIELNIPDELSDHLNEAFCEYEESLN
jgi:uncharacterized protein YdeI (YjbR/CyaY-like superfamily)